MCYHCHQQEMGWRSNGLHFTVVVCIISKRPFLVMRAGVLSWLAITTGNGIAFQRIVSHNCGVHIFQKVFLVMRAGVVSWPAISSGSGMAFQRIAFDSCGVHLFQRPFLVMRAGVLSLPAISSGIGWPSNGLRFTIVACIFFNQQRA